TIRQELTPTEDRAVVLLRINAPQGVSLDYTTEQMRKIEQLIQPLRDSGEIRSTFENAGNNGSYNSGFMVMTLAPWDERSRSQQAPSTASAPPTSASTSPVSRTRFRRCSTATTSSTSTSPTAATA